MVVHTELVCPPAASPLPSINEPRVGGSPETSCTKEELFQALFSQHVLVGMPVTPDWRLFIFLMCFPAPVPQCRERQGLMWLHTALKHLEPMYCLCCDCVMFA